MEYAISIGLAGWVLLAFGALAIGVAITFVGRVAGTYEWLLSSVAAAIGAVIGSEFITGLRAWGPVFDELALVPALVGGLVLAVVAVAVARVAASEAGTTPQAISR